MVSSKPLVFQICDFTQLFDGMDLKESISDLFDSDIVDDHLPIISLLSFT